MKIDRFLYQPEKLKFISTSHIISEVLHLEPKNVLGDNRKPYVECLQKASQISPPPPPPPPSTMLFLHNSLKSIFFSVDMIFINKSSIWKVMYLPMLNLIIIYFLKWRKRDTDI